MITIPAEPRLGPARIPIRPAAAALLEKAFLPIDRVFNRLYSSHLNPLYQSGTLAILCLFILVATGIYTLFFYRTSAPYESVQALEAQWWGGRWIRALHTYSADAMVLLVFVHMLRMLMQGRTWGPRALAWISGVVLVGGLLFSGWTGFVLVWNVQGQMLAVEGARLLDVLPLFSEPIQRSFVGAQGVASSFFFLNLLIHILLPLWLLGMVWVHTLRIAKPAILPPRPLAVWTVAALTLLSVFFPIGMAEKASFNRMIGEVSLDLIFSAWLIPARHLPAWATLLGWLLAGIVAASVPWWWKPRDPAALLPSVSNEDLCTGCTQCTQDCPYGAIAMVPAPPTNKATTLVARVTGDLCVSCGICAGSCAPMVIGPPRRAGRDLLDQAREFAAVRRPASSDLVALVCLQGPPVETLLSGVPGIHVFPLHCASAIHTSAMEYLIRKGVGGIYVLACAGRDCAYRRGPRWIMERVYDGREAELRDRVDRGRVRIGLFGTSEAPEAVAGLLAFKEQIARLAHEIPVEEHVDLAELCEPGEVKRA